MSPALLALLLLGAGASAREPARLEVRVTTPDPRGGGPDVEDAGLTSALAQALVDAGLPASRARGADTSCDDGCVRVLVQRTDAGRFVVNVNVRVNVRATTQSARARLQLDPSAPAFDLAHALAIQVEALADRTHAQRTRTARGTRALVASAADAASTTAAPASEAVAPASDPTASKVEEPSTPTPTPTPTPTSGANHARAVDDASAAALPGDQPPAVRAAPVEPGARDARLAVDVAALVLAAPDGDLFMHGATVGTRVRIGRGGEVRAAIALLRPERRSVFNTPYQRELLPLQLVVASEVPRLPALHVGMGIEAVLVGGEVSGQERPGTWSLGAIGRIEYRHSVRSFALLAAAQAAFHPQPWRTGHQDQGQAPLPFRDMPPWTLGASLGLGFTIL